MAPVFPVNLSVLLLHSVTQIEDIGQRQRNNLYAFDIILSDTLSEIQESVLMRVKDGNGVTLSKVKWVEARVVWLEMEGYRKPLSNLVLNYKPQSDDEGSSKDLSEQTPVTGWDQEEPVYRVIVLQIDIILGWTGIEAWKRGIVAKVCNGGHVA